MIEEYREWGVRSRRTDGPGELIIPARSKEDAEHTAELVRPSDTKIVEIVSRAIGPMETEEERFKAADDLVYLPEVLINGHLAGEGIQEIKHLGAYRRLASAIDAIQERHIVRPDIKLVATLQKPEFPGSLRYLVHSSTITVGPDLQEFFDAIGMVMQIRVETLEP